jgi:hypothetical protein
MMKIAVALPILPGKMEDLKRFLAEVKGPRKEAQSNARRRIGVMRETLWIQQTPRGAMLLLYMEKEETKETSSVAEFYGSQDPYDLWFKPQIKAITGVELAGVQSHPPSEIVFDWQP